MTTGSGAWADRVDALLRDRRELFEAQAEENILMVILLAVPRFGALAIAYALLLLCRVGAPVVNRLKPAWERRSSSVTSPFNHDYQVPKVRDYGGPSGSTDSEGVAGTPPSGHSHGSRLLV